MKTGEDYFQGCPVGAEGVCRHAEYEQAGFFESFVDLCGDVVAGFDDPFVQPDAQTVVSQAFCKGANDRFVFGVVTQENVVFEFVRHAAPFVAARLSSVRCGPIFLSGFCSLDWHRFPV